MNISVFQTEDINQLSKNSMIIQVNINSNYRKEIY